ncbi:origin recognition complex subunit 2-domain-containing protein [Spinellus fusiger]|nr:origin recognition complex subunit 2-domain-containing protein [Spinellus fusiger]
MRVIVQTPEDSFVPIVSTVHGETAKAEGKLASRYKLRLKPGGRGPRGVDLGLTVSTPAKGTPRHSTTQPRVEEYTPLSQSQNELAHTRWAMNVDMAIDKEEEPIEEEGEEREEKEKGEALVASDSKKETTGRDIYGFEKNKGLAGSIMKKTVHQKKDAVEAPPMKKPRGRPKKTLVQPPQQAPKANDEQRLAIEREMNLLKDDRESDEEYDHNEDDHEEKEQETMEEDTKTARDPTESGFNRYFQDLQNGSKTSNNTLSKLNLLTPKEFNAILSATPRKHTEEKERLLNMHASYFSQWKFELHAGFNLLFYGYGSKRRFLNHFSEMTMKDGPLIIINGFFPSIQIKDILAKISADALGITCPTAQILDHAAAICAYFSGDDREYPRLYLVVHNIEGFHLRNENAQNALSMLAQAPNIHLVASVDHINAGLLWDNVKTSQFNWVWHDCTTYDDYHVETSFENSLLMRSSELGGVRGIQYVLTSLTSNGRGVFRVLAEHQLVEMESTHEGQDYISLGLPYHRYYQLCREGFYVSSDASFRSQLTEFKDHKIIHTKRLPDGTDVFYIPLDKQALVNSIEGMAS